MPASPNQKMKLLYLMKFLVEQTDEDNALGINQLIEKLNACGIKAERKSIYDDLALLKRFGLDIEMQRARTFGYYVASRDFELPELKLLVDAVQSSHFITQKKSNELIGKISQLTSESQAKQLKRQVFMANRPKSMNESIYYNIDDIHSAINSGRKIEFKYFDYNAAKQRVYRRQGKPYLMTPLVLCWDDDKYYLVCYNAKYDDFTSFRVDRISSTSVSNEKADRFDRGQLDVADYIKQRFGMYSGPAVRATLRFDTDLMNVALDRFGNNIKTRQVTGGFEVDVDVSESPVFLGWIAQYGSKAEIVSPASLRRSMCDLSEGLVRKYQGS